MRTIAYILLVLAAVAVAAPMVRDLFATPDWATSKQSAPTDTGVENASRNSSAESSEAGHGDSADLKMLADLQPVAGPDSTADNDLPLLSPSPEPQPVTAVVKPPQDRPAQTPPAAVAAAVARKPAVGKHPDLITPANFKYLGGFRPPLHHDSGTFGYGGTGLAFRPNGDPSGPNDGFSGSLYVMGHRHEQLVAEIDIPVPKISTAKKIDDLPVAKVLQGLSDITSGLRKRLTQGASEPFKIGGMHVVGNRLHWTLYKYYNVTGVDYSSHGLTSLNLSNKAIRGLWHVGPKDSGAPEYHSYKSAGYIFDIPQPIADRYFQGRNLASGLQISTGLQFSSQGPAMIAYRVDNENKPANSTLSAQPVLWYSEADPLKNHHPVDSWKGAAWLTLGQKQAVIFVGRKGYGPVRYESPRADDCLEGKGYHADSYSAEVLFYRPQDLIAGMKKKVPSTKPWYRWNEQASDGGLNAMMYQDCAPEIGGVAYDRRNQLLYISEVQAAFLKSNEFEPMPIIHVFRIQE